MSAVESVPEMMITGISSIYPSLDSSASTSKPSISGIFRSSRISDRLLPICSTQERHSAPLPASRML